jgi:hypothetical protein
VIQVQGRKILDRRNGKCSGKYVMVGTEDRRLKVGVNNKG